MSPMWWPYSLLKKPNLYTFLPGKTPRQITTTTTTTMWIMVMVMVMMMMMIIGDGDGDDYMMMVMMKTMSTTMMRTISIKRR